MTTFSLYTATHAEGSLCVSLCGVTHSFEQHHISCISSFVLRRALLTPLPIKQRNVSPSETHGDKLLDYILNRKFQQKIYYYDATDEQEQITSDTIISGLDWMVENNISNINISLSTKYYDTDISTWIKIHPEIHVYCSYNNKDNSYDYPAMYEGVIGSGASKNIKYKAIDKQYYSNQMLIVNNGLHYYYGNSFLSLETMLTNEY